MEKFLTIEETAAIIGLAPQTIYNRVCRQKDLPRHVKLGKALRFPLSEIQVWMSAKIAESPATTSKQPEVEPKPAAAEKKRGRGRPTKAEQIARRAATAS